MSRALPLRARPPGTSRQVQSSRAVADVLSGAQSGCCPAEAGKWGFLQGRVENSKAQTSKVPVLHAPYPWKFEAVLEVSGDRQTSFTPQVYKLYVTL